MLKLSKKIIEYILVILGTTAIVIFVIFLTNNITYYIQLIEIRIDNILNTKALFLMIVISNFLSFFTGILITKIKMYLIEFKNLNHDGKTYNIKRKSIFISNKKFRKIILNKLNTPVNNSEQLI